MGVDGQRIENPESLDYTLERNITHIGITIPIGASGGRLKVTEYLLYIHTQYKDCGASYYEPCRVL